MTSANLLSARYVVLSRWFPNHSAYVTQVMHTLEKNILETSKFDDQESLEEPPTTIVWVYYFLAQHYNTIHKPLKALEYIDKCLEHTPTCLDFHVLRARVYKVRIQNLLDAIVQRLIAQDNGNVDLAAESMEYARTMDLADRYLNNKAVRYYLRFASVWQLTIDFHSCRANNVEKARELIDIFTKATPAEQRREHNNTYTMQVPLQRGRKR